MIKLYDGKKIFLLYNTSCMKSGTKEVHLDSSKNCFYVTCDQGRHYLTDHDLKVNFSDIVTTAKLQTATVSVDKISASAITSDIIDAGTITSVYDLINLSPKETTIYIQPSLKKIILIDGDTSTVLSKDDGQWVLG